MNAVELEIQNKPRRIFIENLLKGRELSLFATTDSAAFDIFIVQKNEQYVLLTKYNYRAALSSLMTNCEKLAKEISIGKKVVSYNEASLKRTMIQYYECTDNKLVDKPKDKFGTALSFRAAAGLSFIELITIDGTRFVRDKLATASPGLGADLGISLEIIPVEKLSLVTEFNIVARNASFSFRGNNATAKPVLISAQIPLLIRYRINRDGNTPYIGAGLAIEKR
jgi:hypothetical protein